MGSAELLHLQTRPGKRREWRQKTLLLSLIVVVALLFKSFSSFQLSTLSTPSTGAETSDFTWADIKPSRTLKWHPCFDVQYDCARLDVPMDWLDPSDDSRVIIAIIRLRATQTTDYRGPVFFNPGGPGGSGIWALKDHGRLLQTIVGENHDIISFDPRGIGASVPRVECWDSIQNRHNWDLQEVPVVDSHPGMLYDAFSRAAAFSRACERTLGETGILQHISTASHARDMLEMLNRLGEEELKYWGFSYGTVLGGTFAAMYPDKVGRLVSDGNVDYREWYTADRINFLRDTDKVMEAFYYYCHQAGPSKCAIYASTPSDIKNRYQSLLGSLRVDPVIYMPDNGTGSAIPEVVTYSKIKRMTNSVLYRPIESFGPFADILRALENGDGKAYYDRVTEGGLPFSDFCTAEPVPPSTPLTNLDEGTDDAFPAILCADMEPLTGTAKDFEGYAQQLQEMSEAVGAVNVLFRISCAGRHIRPKFRFAGPFEANTSFPILFVANKADNITPLISARNNSAGFADSVLLVQNSYGHTTLATPSTCTAQYIRAYFQNGTLPGPDTFCEPDILPFGLPMLRRREFDAELFSAASDLSRTVRWASRRLPL